MLLSLWNQLSNSILLAFWSPLLMFSVVAAAALAPARYHRAVVITGCALLALSASTWWLLFAGPRDLWLRYPSLAFYVHPYTLAFDATFAIPLGLGLIIRGLVARAARPRYHFS